MAHIKVRLAAIEAQLSRRDLGQLARWHADAAARFDRDFARLLASTAAALNDDRDAAIRAVCDGHESDAGISAALVFLGREDVAGQLAAASLQGGDERKVCRDRSIALLSAMA